MHRTIGSFQVLRQTGTLLVWAAGLSLAASAAQAMPGASVLDAAQANSLVEKAAVFVVEGRRYCFYFDGWHGAGWYRCGFAFRRGLGWGGVYGWHGWRYGPADRRFGRGDFSIREGRRDRDFREGSSTRGRTEGRSTTTTESRSTRSRSGEQTTTGTRMRQGGVSNRGMSTRGETTGRGPRSESGAMHRSGGPGGSGSGVLKRSPEGGGTGGGGGSGGGASGGGG